MARQIAPVGRPASKSAITVSGSAAAASATSPGSAPRAIEARSRNGARRSFAIRSTSSSTPSSRLPAVSTGRCLIPRSSISSSASVPVRSADTVQAGAVITSDSGVPGPAPAATTRVRMSRSVTIPSRSPRSTTTQVAPASAMRRAASWTLISGGQTSAGALISSPTGRPAAESGGSALSPARKRRRSFMTWVTKRTKAGRPSTGRMTSAGIR